ncbi:MAG: hypothetical protein QOG63_706 [Thermoleophilaceae bacterium]|jgi:hypothetical protein|nr:hypothetical protein [Thermoleophilaceae bacterium]
MPSKSLPIRPTVAAIAAGALILVPAVDAAKSKPPQKAGATYTGFTSQGKTNCRSKGQNDKPCTVSVKVSGDGTRVAKAQIYFFAKCDNDLVFRSSTVFKNPRIKKGKFTVNANYPENLGDGSSADNSVITHGTFRRKRHRYTVVGDYKISSDLQLSDGSTTHCQTPKVTFKAKP